MKFRGPQALDDTLEFAFSLTSCRRRSPAQIGKTIQAACCMFTLLPLPNMFAAGALYGIGGHLFC